MLIKELFVGLEFFKAVDRPKIITMSSSDSFTYLESTNKFFGETEFVYLFLCTVNVNNNIQFRRFVVKPSDEQIITYFLGSTSM